MKKITKFFTWSFVVMLVMVIAYGIVGELMLPDERESDGVICREFYDGWEMVLSDGSTTPIEAPGRFETEDPNGCVVTNTLPQIIDRESYLIFRSSKQDMRIYIDGELRTEYSTVDSRWFGKASPTYYVFVKLTPADAGKRIDVSYHSIAIYAGVISEIYFADYSGFMRYMGANQGPVLFVAVMMFVVGLLSLIIGFATQHLSKQQQKLTSISVAVIIVSMWMVGNSMFRQFLFHNVSVIADMTFLMVAFMPFPFASYIDMVQQGKHAPAYFVVKLLTVLDVVTSIVLYIAGLREFSESFYVMAALLLLLFIVLFVTSVMDLITGFIKTYVVTAIAMLIAGVIMLAQVTLYMVTDLTLDVSFAALGLFILLGVALVDTIRDIYRLSKERQVAVAENSAKSQFLANMSHEIRTPINAVLGMNTMILRESNDDKIKRYALDIQSAGKSLLSLINDILDFSKIESGKMALAYVDYSMATVLHDVISMARQKATDRKLVFETEIDETIPCNYLGDDVRVRQILTNLLTNAMKYTPRGKVTFSVQQETNEKNGDLYLIFSVKDTGIGIKEEDIDKLTSQFVRIEESRNRNIEGTGLGLNIVVSLLQMMGSELHVESEYGKGSCFYFKLKQMVTNSEPMGDIYSRVEKVSSDEEEISFICPKAKILIVDDNAINRRVFKHLLRKYECHVDEAESGKQCLYYVEHNRYDMIFMDHMMPQMDGVETYRRMKALGKYLNTDTPVIALTANAIVGAKEYYLQEGFHDYLSKPIEIPALDAVMDHFIADDKKEYNSGEKKEASNIIDEKEFPYIDGIDWQYAVDKLNDTEILKETIKGFLTTNNVELQKLMHMYKAIVKSADDERMDAKKEAMDAFRIQVHSMKTTAATLGAIHLAGLAKYTEYAARDYDKTTIERLMPVLSREWNVLANNLSEHFKKLENEAAVEDGNLPEVNREQLAEMLKSLSLYMKDLNIDPADEIMEKLHQFSYEEDEQALLEALSAHVMNMDQTACDETINEWLERMA